VTVFISLSLYGVDYLTTLTMRLDLQGVNPYSRIMQNLLMATQEVLTVSDIARELEISRQALYQREGEKKLPPPDFRTVQGQPLWKRSTLEKKGIL
jgi:hypothetical protein